MAVETKFNINLTDWNSLKNVLPSEGWGWWNVIDQWNKTADSKYYNTFRRTPIALIMLKHSQKFLIYVWGKAAWDSEMLTNKHSIRDVIVGLPPKFGGGGKKT